VESVTEVAQIQGSGGVGKGFVLVGIELRDAVAVIPRRGDEKARFSNTTSVVSIAKPAP